VVVRAAPKKWIFMGIKCAVARDNQSFYSRKAVDIRG